MQEARHRSADRPTDHAWRDADEAADDELLRDARRQTIIVLGKRNRAHVFSATARHITSLRLEGDELARKVQGRRWVALDESAARSFRAALAAGARRPDEEAE